MLYIGAMEILLWVLDIEPIWTYIIEPNDIVVHKSVTETNSHENKNEAD